MLSKDQTKQNIKEAFWALYEKNRIEKITVSSICKSAGYNRSTFYAYFNNVYDVLDDIEEEILTREDFEKIILNNILYETSRQKIIGQVVGLYEEKNRYLTVLLGDRGDPAFRSKLVKRIAPVIISLLNCQDESVKLKLTYLMEYQSSGILSIITEWFRQGQHIPVEELIEILMSVTMNGIQKEMTKIIKVDMIRKGKKLWNNI